jgi:hypothetical protein
MTGYITLITSSPKRVCRIWDGIYTTLLTDILILIHPRPGIKRPERRPGATAVGEGIFQCDGRSGTGREDTGIYKGAIRARGQE